MAGRHLEELTYGQLGKAAYDKDRQEWYFQRPLYRYNGVPTISCVLSTFECKLGGSVMRNQEFSVYRRKQIKTILSSLPEIVPIGPLLPELCHVSETIDALTACYDPITSDLFDFGVAKGNQEETLGENEDRVIALVGGLCRERVQVTRLTSEPLEWEDSSRLWFNTMRIDNRDTFWWTGPNGPVQQVCFSGKDGHPSGWLAIRTLQHITILRPTLRDGSTARKIDRHRRGYPASTSLLVDEVLEISLVQQGRILAHIAFDPWNEQQIAAIDTKGRLTVWYLEVEEKTRSRWTTRLDLTVFDSDKERSQSTEKTDGWGVVMWTGDTEIIVAATRTMFSVRTISTPETFLEVPEVLPEKELGWILDVKRSGANPFHVFVLTSHRLFRLSLLNTVERETEEETNIEAKIILSCLHYRDPRDLSLCMSLCADQNGSLVNLYSTITGHSTIHEFSIPTRFNPNHSLSDPFVVRNSSSKDAVRTLRQDTTDTLQNVGLSRPLQMRLERVDCLHEDDTESETSGPASLVPGIRAYELYQLCSDSKLVISLYIFSRSSELQNKNLVSVKPPRTMREENSQDDFLSDFIIPDDRNLEDDRGLSKNYTNLSPRATTSVDADDVDTWTISFDWLVSIVLNNLAMILEESSPLRSLEVMVARLFENKRKEDIGIRTLADLLPGGLPVTEVDEASEQLQALLDQVHDVVTESEPEDEVNDGSTSRTLRSVSVVTPAIVRMFQGLEGEQTDVVLLPIYEALLNEWVAPLPPDIPGKPRVRLQRHIKQIAIELFLASTGIQTVQQKHTAEGTMLNETQFILPVRKKRSSSNPSARNKNNTNHSSQNYGGAEVSPKNSQRMPQSSDPGTSHQSLGPRHQYVPSENLQNYTPLDPQDPLPDHLTKLTDRWEIGSDPNNIDWLSAISNSTSQELENASNQAKAKFDRQMEKRQQASQSQGLPSSSQMTHRSGLEQQAQSSPWAPQSSQLPRSSQFTAAWTSSPPAASGHESEARKRMGGLGSSQVTERLKPPAKKKRKEGF